MAPSATDTRRKLIDAATRAFADDGCSPPRSSRSPARPDRRTGARSTGTVNAANAAPPFTLGMDVGKWVVAMANQSLGGMADFALCGTAFDAPPELANIEAAAFTLPSTSATWP